MNEQLSVAFADVTKSVSFKILGRIDVRMLIREAGCPLKGGLRLEDTSRTYGERFASALEYAERLHRDQLRRGTEIPYITHLLAVTALVGEHGGTEDEAISALLHDAVEDQGGAETLANIRARFGVFVADVVVACSDTDQEPKPPWKPRKERYIALIGDKTYSACLVSAADKLHNARSILADLRAEGDHVWERFNAPCNEQLWYYTALTHAFRDRCRALRQTTTSDRNSNLERLIDELDRVVHEVVELAETPSEINI